jgi:hypothetical protein
MNSTSVTDPPMAVAFLIRALENQLKMHDFMAVAGRGGKAERCYIDGLKESTTYLLRRIKTEGIKDDIIVYRYPADPHATEATPPGICMTCSASFDLREGHLCHGL